MTQVHFDEATHTYTVDDRIIPGITEILTKTGIIPYMGPDVSARDEGSMVHKAIEIELEGNLDRESAEWLLGYVDCAMGWLERTRHRDKVCGVEYLVYHGVLGYATKIDAVIIDEGLTTLVNWKTGNVYPWHAIQAEAEMAAYRAKNPDVHSIKHIGVYLVNDKDRYPICVEHALHFESKVWVSACEVYNWISSNGGITRPKTQKTTPVVLPVPTDIFEREHHENQIDQIDRPETGLFD